MTTTYKSTRAADLSRAAQVSGLARLRADGGIEWMPGFVPIEMLIAENAARLGASPPPTVDLSTGSPLDPEIPTNRPGP